MEKGNEISKVDVKITGKKGSFGAALHYDGKAVTDGEKGDISIVLEQSDGGKRISLSNIMYDTAVKEGNTVTLQKKLPIPEMIAYLEIKVCYEIINEYVVKKEVTLLQRNAPQIYYSIDNYVHSSRQPDKFWSFDEFTANEETDMHIQRFPALGYAVDGAYVGLISENGYINEYVRNRRKRKIVDDFGYDAFEPILAQPDSEFMRISKTSEDGFFVKMTIGEYQYDNEAKKTGLYNILPLGKPKKKTFYMFAAEVQDIRALKLTVQEAYCDGRGFIGTQPEKVLFADAQINITCAEINDKTPHSVPAVVGYAPDMYNRDTFWTITGCGDRELNEILLSRWFDTQDEAGCIGTIITPVTGSVEVKDNDSTILMFLWAYRNQKEYGAHNIPKEKLDLAYQYCRNALDPKNVGRCTAHFALSQQDISYYEDGEQLSVNQGMYAVFLRAALNMGYPVDSDYLELVEETYRSYYDDEGHTLRLYDKDEITTSFDNLVPEFLSLWLHEHKILTDEQVCGMLTHYPESNVKDARALFVKRDGKNLTLEEWPFKKNEYNKPGMYYNGGSWLRGEVMAYATGFCHGYKQGKEMITRRLQAELDRYIDDPVSHEFLPTDVDYPYDDWIRNNSVFSWNVFALVAEEMVGLR